MFKTYFENSKSTNKLKIKNTPKYTKNLNGRGGHMTYELNGLTKYLLNLKSY